MKAKVILCVFILVSITLTISAQSNVGAVVFPPYNSNGNQQNTFYVPEQQQRQPSFQDGWEQGYKDGWCYGRGYGCIDPIVPICPIARIGEDNYKGGYNRAFLQGLNDHK